MKISQVGETFTGRNNSEVDVQVAVGLLSLCYHVDKLLDTRLYRGVDVLLEKIACSLDPFRDVGLKEEMIGHRPDFGFFIVDGQPSETKCIVAASGL